MRVKVYSTEDCQRCRATVRLLKKLGVDHEDILTTGNEEARQEALSYGHLTSPVVVWGDSNWSGFRPEKIHEMSQALVTS